MLLNDTKILKRLQRILDTESAKYNILTSNFVFVDHSGDMKHVSLESTINLLKDVIVKNDGNNVEDISDVVELYNLLRKLHDSYFVRRLKVSVLEFYEAHNLQVPRNIFIENGDIYFTSSSFGDKVFPVKYDDNFDIFLNELEEKIARNCKESQRSAKQMAREHQQQKS